VRDRRNDPVSQTAGFDQPRRVGGSGSGVRLLPRRTVVVGQNASVGFASRAASTGASLRTAMGITQPIAAMQARVMPLQGFCAGCCCCAIIFMQSSDIPDIAIGADIAGGPDAKAASWPSKPVRAPSRRRRCSTRFTAEISYARRNERAMTWSPTVPREYGLAGWTESNDVIWLRLLARNFHAKRTNGHADHG
jgi:hypothetical protein